VWRSTLELPAGGISLQIQGSQQSVTVTSAAPALKTDRAEVSEALKRTLIQELPT